MFKAVKPEIIWQGKARVIFTPSYDEWETPSTFHVEECFVDKMGVESWRPIPLVREIDILKVALSSMCKLKEKENE